MREAVDFDRVYSCLIYAAWLFLGGWVSLLVVASVAAFRKDNRPIPHS